ncbi:MAG: DUF7657 domain-containing protein [Armatimonadota bacterium]
MKWLETNRGRDLAAVGLIALLVLILLWPVTFGGKLLLPADMLMVMQPWKAHAQELGFERVHTPFLDAIQQHYPWRKFAAEQMREGIIPLWNPYMFCGAPFVANNQSACFYPETWLFMLMPPERAFGWSALFSLIMGGAFMFAFLRLLGLRRSSAVAGTIPFLFCGFLVGWMLLPTVRAVPMWLPLMLLAFERCLRALMCARSSVGGASSPNGAEASMEGPAISRPAVRDSHLSPNVEPIPQPTAGRVIPGPSNGSGLSSRRAFLWASVCALAVGLQFLAGHLHVSFFVLLIFGAYAVFRLLQTHALGDRRAAYLGLAYAAASTFTGVLLAMLQLLPVFELVGMNPRRAGQTFEAVKGNAMIPAYLLAGLMPDLFGNPVDYNFWGWSLFSTNREYVETVWYMGIATVVLIVAAVIWRSQRRSQTWFWTGLWLTGAGMAWGTIFYLVLFELIPPLRQLPGISRAVFICNFAGAILAAFGFEAILRKLQAPDPHGIRRVIDRTAVIIGLIAILGGIGVWLYTGRLEDSIPGLGAYSLVQLLRCLALLLATVGAVAVMTWCLASSAGIASAAPQKKPSQAKSVPSAPIAACIPSWRLSLGKALLIAVLAADLLYFAGHFLPAVPARYLQVQSDALARIREDSGLYRMTSLIGDGKGIDRMPPNLTMAFGFQDVLGSDSLVFDGYQNLMSIVPKDAKGNPDPTSPILDMLNCKYLLTSQDLTRTPGWKLLTEYETNVYENTEVLPRAFIAAKIAVAPHEEPLKQMTAQWRPMDVTFLNGIPSPVAEGPASIAVTDYGANSVTLEGSVPAGRLAVLGDIWYPGWHAYADAQETPIRRANYILRAVAPEREAQQIRFVYYPASFAAGAFLTCLAVMFIACGLVIGWRRR